MNENTEYCSSLYNSRMSVSMKRAYVAEGVIMIKELEFQTEGLQTLNSSGNVFLK